MAIEYGLNLTGATPDRVAGLLPRQHHDMVRLVSVLLNDVRGDALLLFNGEVVWLLRADGQLTLSDRDDHWTPELLALLPAPYERRGFPIL
jgi:hypothetical protein